MRHKHHDRRAEFKIQLAYRFKNRIGMEENMNSYERVMNRFEGKEVDKVPNLNIIMGYGAQLVGYTYKEYASDYRKLVEANLYCCEHFGIDAVSCISDPMREAEAMGATVTMPEDDVPYCKEHFLKDYDMVKDIKIVDPMDSPRTADRVNAVKLYAEKVKGIYPIIGWVEGVLAESADLRGLSEILMDLMEDPDEVVTLFDKVYEQQFLFAKAQVEAGADIIGIGNAAASLVGPSLYEEYIMEYDRKLVAAIQALGAKTKLHICGDITPLLDSIKVINPDMVDVDWMVDLKTVVEAFKGTHICASGNLDPVSVFLQGSVEEVEAETRKCLDIADEKTFLAGGCEIPKSTPRENMIAMNQVLFL